MKKIVYFILLSVILISCAPMPLLIDDRLSYSSNRAMRNEFGRYEKINFEIDKNTEGLVILQRPSSITTSAVTFSFSIGKVFSAYLYQINEALFIEECNDCLSVKVKITDCKIAFTNSALTHWSTPARVVVDYFKMDISIEVQYQKNNKNTFVKNYHYTSVKSLKINEIDTANSDTAIVWVIEDVVKKLVQDIIKEQNINN